MPWPDREERLLNQFLAQLGYAPKNLWGYRSMLRHFQRFVSKQEQPLGIQALRSWLQASASESTSRFVVDRACFVKRFLDWLVERGLVASCPFTELRERYQCQSTSAIVRALLEPKPMEALEALRPQPRYASHLGPLMCEHVARMRFLGLRYEHEGCFLRFDRFLQKRPGAEAEPFAKLSREYADAASSPAGKLARLRVTRVVAQALQRAGEAVAVPAADRLLLQEVTRKRTRPYIYSSAEIEKLLETARSYQSSKAPLRAATLYCMITLAYCAGLRLAEFVDLEMQDVNLVENTIEVRDSKFFKSRCLPLSSSAMAVLRTYLAARSKAGAASAPDAPLFCHLRGGYSCAAVAALLRGILRLAGLKTNVGRGGPRIHDLRHTFVVHRMMQWYEQGINPQSRLAHLATYLGHRDIHSTLVYLTVTQELLQLANQRFRAAEADVLKVIQGKS